jgi:hypothetical protein
MGVGEGEIVKSSERGGNGDWRMRGGLFHLTSFSYSSPDSMSGIHQIGPLLNSDHFVEALRDLGGLISVSVFDISKVLGLSL